MDVYTLTRGEEGEERGRREGGGGEERGRKLIRNSVMITLFRSRLTQAGRRGVSEVLSELRQSLQDSENLCQRKRWLVKDEL